ncbi:DUF1801 domain-containing protein [Variovorax sp. LT1R16]|uniref:DUF1801 domain-containing protein n=1 Tax=Variovorax sp. LT1R16 TaxID=3443728 RepID=UPI003F44F9A8
MKSVEALVEDIRLVSEERYETVQAVRTLIGKLVEPLSEEVKYGGILFSSGEQFGGVFAYRDHVSVEFSMGAAIIDPFAHLEGGGKLRRHLKLTSPADIESKRLVEYVPLAVKAANDAA